MNQQLAPTCGHKTLGVKWLINRSTSHQGLVSVDTFAAPKTPTFHTAIRLAASEGNRYDRLIRANG
jgi:hypothetical protein